MSTLRPRTIVPSETLSVRPSGSSTPVPGTTVTLRPFSSDSSPEVRRSTTACLRVCDVASCSAGAGRQHAELGGGAHRAQHLGRLQQLLGRDAARGAGRCRRPAAPRPSRCSCPRSRRRARRRSPPGPPPRTTRSKSSGIWSSFLSSGGGSGEVRGHRFTRMTWRANATRIAKPVSAARTMYVRVLTATSTLSNRSECASSARIEASPPPFAHRSARRGRLRRRPSNLSVRGRACTAAGGRRQEASRTRRHLGDRRGPHHRRAQRVRLPDPRRQAAVERRLQRAQRPLGDGVRLHARAVPAARTRGRARGGGPAGPRRGRRPAREAGGVARRDARARGRRHRARSRTGRSSTTCSTAAPRCSSASSSRSSVYYVAFITRGTLSGNGRFGAVRPHARLRGHGPHRRVPRAVRRSASKSVGPLRPRARRAAAVRGRDLAARADATSCCPAPRRRTRSSRARSAWLLLGSVLAQLLSYASVLRRATCSRRRARRTSRRTSSPACSSPAIPLLLFQAVQAALLPKLAGLASEGKHDDFRIGMRRLIARRRRRCA